MNVLTRAEIILYLSTLKHLSVCTITALPMLLTKITLVFLSQCCVAGNYTKGNVHVFMFSCILYVSFSTKNFTKCTLRAKFPLLLLQYFSTNLNFDIKELESEDSVMLCNHSSSTLPEPKPPCQIVLNLIIMCSLTS